jgi:glycosyltransferase involved in cell wall biosynthesis
MNKISVIIITSNEEENIEDCLESVKWADEIILVDSESTDRTVEIAKEYTGNIFIKKWEGFSKQKRFALENAGNELVLSIDADERIHPELAEEIKNKDLTVADGFYIRRENYFLGKLIKGCGWGKDYQMRLFRKSKVSVTENLVHEGFIVERKDVRLDNPIIHFTNKSLHQAIEKSNEYSTLEVLEKYKVKKINVITIIFKPVFELYQHFIARKGFKDGIYGFLVSIMHALTKLMFVSKLWETNNKEIVQK